MFLLLTTLNIFGRLRALWRAVRAGICYILFGAGALCIGIVFRILSVIPFIAPLTKQIWIRWWIHKGCLTFIRLMRLLGLIQYRYHFSNLKQYPQGNIVIANHPSLIDAVFIFAYEKNISCLVKSALWSNFFTGDVARLAGYIPNNTPEAVLMAAEKLRRGENLLIFPEGTRTKRAQPLHFRRGAANIAVATNMPILPIFIECKPAALGKGDKWYSIPQGGASFTLRLTRSLSLDECIDTSKPNTLQYRDLTQFLEQFYRQTLDNKTVARK